MKSKEELLAALHEEFDHWESLLERLPEQKIIAREMPAGLSIKDVVAHLRAWQGLSIARLEAARDNRDPQYDLGPEGLDPDAEENVERINAWIHAKYLDMPWADVNREWRQGFEYFLQLARIIPEEAFMQPARYPWLKDHPLADVLRSSYDHHHDEHYEPLVAWLRQKGWIPA